MVLKIKLKKKTFRRNAYNLPTQSGGKRVSPKGRVGGGVVGRKQTKAIPDPINVKST